MTSQGHPRTVFRRALQNGNLLLAEITACEVGKVDLHEALELTALIAKNDATRSRRVATRWLRRWLEETDAPTIDDAVMVAGCLAALGGARHDQALVSLRAVGQRATTRPTSHHVR
ncbi:MAG: hypothetical protein M3P18_05020 [Actinomycetota bacterium]|nr:hypothetical protein [Actinomycetota bacterium]